MIYLVLFWEFFKTGLFAVGGGLATIPFLNDMVERYHWVTQQELANIIAIAESTPGPIGVNAATYMGISATSAGGVMAGLLGGIVATFALVLPSVIVISLIAGALEKYANARIIQDTFRGLRPAATGLVAAAGFSVLLVALQASWSFSPLSFYLDYRCAILFALLLICTQLKWTKNLHPVLYILFGGAVGALLSL